MWKQMADITQLNKIKKKKRDKEESEGGE